MQGIKNIVFDLGGVLMDLDKQACINAFHELGYAEAELLLDNYAQKGAFLALEEGMISPEQFRDQIRRDISHPVTDNEIDRAFCAFLLDIPTYKLDMLRSLKERYQILMLSNTNVIMTDVMKTGVFKKQGMDIYAYFDKLYLSYEMKVAKPQRAIFDQLIADSGICPEETLFFDDSPANIEMGAEVGFHTYLTQPREDFRPWLQQQGLIE